MPYPPSAALDAAVRTLAARFASELFAAIAAVSPEELLNSPPRPVGAPTPRHSFARRPRQTASSDLSRSQLLARVVAHLASRPEGQRAEELRRDLALEKAAFARAAADGLATGELRKEGRLRATVYFSA